jgi:hypothetical protein
MTTFQMSRRPTQIFISQAHSLAVGSIPGDADMQTYIEDSPMAALARSVADHLGPLMVEQLRVDLALGDDAVFTIEEAGRIIRRSPGALRAWRASGVGPRTVKLSPRDFGPAGRPARLCPRRRTVLPCNRGGAPRAPEKENPARPRRSDTKRGRQKRALEFERLNRALPNLSSRPTQVPTLLPARQ